jgi:hypothetical protein
MPDHFTRSSGRALHPMLPAWIAFAAIALFLSSCSADLSTRYEPQSPTEQAPRFSIVFVIHGDGDYLYHDTSGVECTADEESLAGARRIAERNPLAEVFIFHQIPRKHFLFFFPIHDGEFYYYRNGLLRATASYWRDQGESRFGPEADLYRSVVGSRRRAATRLFVYSGHEIPEWAAPGYDASQPDRTFSVDDLAGALKAFTRDSVKFDLMILSTCFGGTPRSIGALAAYARFIIASPDNLHLSYFDLHPLERLDIGLGDGDLHAFARRIARQSFERLTRDVQTAVSVSVYDAEGVQEYLHSVRQIYDSTLSALRGESKTAPAAIERCDCAGIPSFLLPAMHKGVEVLYRPARFGRSRLVESHSGWECWKEKGKRESASQATGAMPK